jgi:hypothetical protein
MLTRLQVLLRFRQPGSVLAIERTTYGHIHAVDPSLAVGDVIYPAWWPKGCRPATA